MKVKAKRGKEGRAICAIKPDGSMAGWFENRKQLFEYIGRELSSLSQALNRGKFCLGLKWMYLDEYRDKWMKGEDMSYTIPPYHDYRSRGECHLKKGMGREFYFSMPKEVLESIRQRARDRQIELVRSGEVVHIPCAKVRCVETGEVFFSMGEAARKVGCCVTTIHNAVRLGYKIRKHNLHFERIDDSNDIKQGAR